MPLSGVYAQEEKKQYLPEEGDFSISFSVTPLLKYAGNLFNNSTDNSLKNLGGEPVTANIEKWYHDINPDVSIMGKYMLTDNFGLRANIGLMFRNNYNNFYVQDDKAVSINPFDETKLTDRSRDSKNGASVMLGAEYRLGHRRVQGVFSAGIRGGMQNTKSKYEYANQITSINQKPSSGFNTSDGYGYRLLTRDNGRDYIMGLVCSAGVDWFVAPKVALGAEVNFTAYYLMGGQIYTISEGYNHVTKQVETRTDIKSPGDNTLYIGTDNVGGSLYISFYF